MQEINQVENYNDLAQFLGDRISADDSVTVTVNGSEIVITAQAVDVDFPVSVNASNGGTVNDQTITLTVTQEATATDEKTV